MINDPMKLKTQPTVNCPNCNTPFIFAPRCPECGQLIDYGISNLFFTKNDK